VADERYTRLPGEDALGSVQSGCRRKRAVVALNHPKGVVVRA
jgi:hypothetical protein